MLPHQFRRSYLSHGGVKLQLGDALRKGAEQLLFGVRRRFRLVAGLRYLKETFSTEFYRGERNGLNQVTERPKSVP